MSDTSSKTKEFTFTWNLENYSYNWQKKDHIKSPVFYADTMEKTTWYLSLHTSGGTAKSFIALFLNRSVYDDGPTCIVINYELSFLNADGSLVLSSEVTEEHEFPLGENYGCHPFLKRDRVLFMNKDQYFPQDILTARCKMWMDTRHETEVGQSSACTRFVVEKVYFLHTVERFSNLRADQKKTVIIHSSSDEEPMMFVSVLIVDGSCCGEIIMVEIEPYDVGEITIFTCNLNLVNATGKLIECGREDNRFDSDRGRLLKVPLLFTKKKLMDDESELLPNDRLLLRCECIFSTGLKFDLDYSGCESHLLNSALHFTPNLTLIAQGVMEYNVAAQISDDSSRALDDFGFLYNHKILCDVTLKTQTAFFHAHKAVLCARSDFFKVVLTKEKGIDAIDVNDLEDETVRRMLMFLYTEELDAIEWEVIFKLYHAAQNYQMKRLKEKCFSILVSQLSVYSVCDVLLLAVKRKDSALNEAAQKFILRHDAEIFPSHAWEKFAETDPSLAVKIMRLKYRKT